MGSHELAAPAHGDLARRRRRIFEGDAPQRPRAPCRHVAPVSPSSIGLVHGQGLARHAGAWVLLAHRHAGETLPLATEAIALAILPGQVVNTLEEAGVRALRASRATIALGVIFALCWVVLGTT